MFSNSEAAILQVFYKNGILKSFANYTGKRLCSSLFFNKVADLIPATLLKKRLKHRCYQVNFAKFLRPPLNRIPLVDYLHKLHFILKSIEHLTNICHYTCTSYHNKCHQGVQVYYRRQTTQRRGNSACFYSDE